MSAGANAAKLGLMLKAVKGRLDRAESALASVLGRIRAHAAEAQECAALLAKTPAIGGDDPAFVAFADRRRAALKARKAVLSGVLSNLYTDEKSGRADVERFLRQKISIEEAAGAAKTDDARARAKGR